MRQRLVSIMATPPALVLVGTTGFLSLQYQQQAWSSKMCPSCMHQFKKLTNEFEKETVQAWDGRRHDTS
ncbi:MAG TPA: hypothetical protein VH415_04220 [Nitrososphaeraceae archaeon]|jgi:hypothetical protein